MFKSNQIISYFKKNVKLRAEIKIPRNHVWPRGLCQGLFARLRNLLTLTKWRFVRWPSLSASAKRIFIHFLIYSPPSGFSFGNLSSSRMHSFSMLPWASSKIIDPPDLICPAILRSSITASLRNSYSFRFSSFAVLV